MPALHRLCGVLAGHSSQMINLLLVIVESWEWDQGSARCVSFAKVISRYIMIFAGQAAFQSAWFHRVSSVCPHKAYIISANNTIKWRFATNHPPSPTCPNLSVAWEFPKHTVSFPWQQNDGISARDSLGTLREETPQASSHPKWIRGSYWGDVVSCSPGISGTLAKMPRQVNWPKQDD